MKVGDKVKVDKIGGFYPTYKEWAEIVGAKRWTNNKYPESMEFVVEAIGNHLTESITLYLLSNDEGEFIFDNIHSNIATVKRTRTEYEKVTESIFDLRDEFVRGELFMKGRGAGGDFFNKITTEYELVTFASRGLYRKVEKEIDWRNEVHEWQHTKKIGIYTPLDFVVSDLIESHPDKFLELCRVALRANGELD